MSNVKILDTAEGRHMTTPDVLRLLATRIEAGNIADGTVYVILNHYVEGGDSNASFTAYTNIDSDINRAGILALAQNRQCENLEDS